MNTERLEEFTVLAERLSYSRAAESLFISQSILSRHINELEEEAGCRLFKRDTHGVELTEEGKFFRKWAEQYLRKEEQILSSMAEEPFTEGDTVKVICSEQVITTRILSFVHDFTATYPAIHLDIIPVMSDENKELLYSCDIMLTPADFLNTPSDSISVVRLTDQESLLAIPPQNRLGDYQEISLADLSGQTIIVPFMENLYGPYARNAAAVSRKCHGSVRRINVENAQAGLLKVELGLGVMLIPHHLSHRRYPHTQLIPVADPDCVFPVFAYRNNTSKNRAADLFYEKICGSFAYYSE